MIEWAAPPAESLRRQPLALLSLAWLCLAATGALLAPLLAPYDPLAPIPNGGVLLPPRPAHPLGTDALGRDVLSRLLWGGRWTLGMGILALTIALALGLPMGVVAGFFEGVVDQTLMRVVDALLAFPALLLAMALVAIMGPGILPVAIAVGGAAAPAYARVARRAVIEVRVEPYIEAATVAGGGAWHVLRRHVLPNAAGSLLAFGATQLGWVLLNGAALNFLGLGAAPGTPEWGAMISEGRAHLRNAPWVSTLPGLTLTLTVVATNLLGDGIQESLRPRS